MTQQQQNADNKSSSLISKLMRRKPTDTSTQTDLNRCLGLWSLFAIGIGSTLGLGLYVLAGEIASKKSGPAVIISFAFAAGASALSAICYAEFAGLVPKAGSAYAYSYITVGEFPGFIIGWNMVLEYVIGAASVARGFSGYSRSLFVPTLALNATTPVELVGNSTAIERTSSGDGWTSFNFDWLTLLIIASFTLLMLGVNLSAKVTFVFTCVNLLVVVFTIVACSTRIDGLKNWYLTPEQVPPGAGNGGFFPYGWSGVLAGSATCFFGFIGFDTIASSAEEAISPRKDVPMSILISLFVSFLAYFGVATVQTLVLPYYEQDHIAVLPFIFDRLNMPWIRTIVQLGALAGLSSSQLGAIYPLPRILYSMSRDRLIYSPLATINKRLKLPVNAIICGSIFTGLLALTLNIEQLADMVSIGTLLAYTLVSVSVLILRYEPPISANTLHTKAIENGKLGSDDISCHEQLMIAKSTQSKYYISCSIALIIAIDAMLYAMVSLELSAIWNSVCSGQVFLSVAVVASFIVLLIVVILMNRLPTYSHYPSSSSSNCNSEIFEDCGQTSLTTTSMVLTNVTTNQTTTNGNDHPITTNHQTNEREQSENISLAISDTTPDESKTKHNNICTDVQQKKNVNFDTEHTNTKTIDKSIPEPFRVPLVPLIPLLSIAINVFLMLNLSSATWIRFSVWMSVGLFIYFTYGIRNSRGYVCAPTEAQEIR
ncbi:Cationic amino acid transporter 2 [Fragariocoptes setiger]|uniref:Cationic amino acid transporter 2 n=1 Tax=Fragariocoptes setiger TaxID=1670756 RepID=A0ABQ7SC64_9ACAR|nr:Cationic amino acid transporter 2 [Fragariocoptes setiger]